MSYEATKDGITLVFYAYPDGSWSERVCGEWRALRGDPRHRLEAAGWTFSEC